MSDIISSLEDLDKDLAGRLYSEAAEEIEEIERADAEKQARKKGPRRGKGGFGAGDSQHSVPAGSASSWEMPLPKGDMCNMAPYANISPMRRPPMDKTITVTMVMYESSKQKFFDWGLCGIVTEREYKGRTYAFEGAPTYIGDADGDAQDSNEHL